MSPFLKRTLLAASLTLVAVPHSWAWGREGHRLTALVAEEYLTPKTKVAVEQLLGKESMAGVSTWADEYRSQNPATGPWHFVDIPQSEATYNRDRDCPANRDNPASPWRDCVVDRIVYFETQLANPALPREDRYQALKYLIHFIGDVHQPLHAIGDARGGNDIHVRFLGSDQCGTYKCNLHGVWDEELIDHERLSEPKMLAMLTADIREHNWEARAGGTPIQWANASHQYAVNAFAPNGALLESNYVAEETQVVNSQLAIGGLRLARVLNTLLGGEAVPPFPKGEGPGNPDRKPLPPPAPAATSTSPQ